MCFMQIPNWLTCPSATVRPTPCLGGVQLGRLTNLKSAGKPTGRRSCPCLLPLPRFFWVGQTEGGTNNLESAEKRVPTLNLLRLPGGQMDGLSIFFFGQMGG